MVVWDPFFIRWWKTRYCKQGHAPPWWRHQMESFSALLVLCAGNSPVTGEFPSQRPVTQSFDVFFDLRLNKRLSKQLWGWWFETPSGSLWRHCNGPFNPPSTRVFSQQWRVGMISRTFSNSNLNFGHFHNCTLNTRRISMGRLLWLHSLTCNAMYMCCNEHRVITGVFCNCHKRLEKVRTASVGFKSQLKSYGRDENAIKQTAK